MAGWIAAAWLPFRIHVNGDSGHFPLTSFPFLSSFNYPVVLPFVTDPSPFSLFSIPQTFAMDLYPSVRFLNAAWIAKSWMYCCRATCYDANAFSLSAVEASAVLDGFLSGNVHLDWFLSLKWRHRCLLFTHSLVPFYSYQTWRRHGTLHVHTF